MERVQMGGIESDGWDKLRPFGSSEGGWRAMGTCSGTAKVPAVLGDGIDGGAFGGVERGTPAFTEAAVCSYAAALPLLLVLLVAAASSGGSSRHSPEALCSQGDGACDSVLAASSHSNTRDRIARRCSACLWRQRMCIFITEKATAA